MFTISPLGQIILRVYYKMRGKRKSEKKSNSKSLEKRPASRRQELNLFLDADINCCDKSKAFAPDIA